MLTGILHRAGRLEALCAAIGVVGFWNGFSYAADNVAGNLITFNNDGAWCWYQDERVVVDKVGGKILIGTNGDGIVDLADYNNVVNNLGATGGAGLAVPEPASVMMWLLGGLGILLYRH